MDRQDIEALLQGSLDDTLTPEQRDTLRRLLAESAELRGRADHLEQLTELLESLPLADAPPRLAHDVLERISRPAGVTPARSFVRVAAPKRGVPVKKSMIFGLAAAA
jgi:hypothetical protein